MENIFFTLLSYIATFFLGVLFGRFFRPETTKIEVQWLEVVKIITLGTMFFTFLASLIQAQFYNGEDPTLWLSLMGVFSFGSLIGERDFFAKIINAYTRSNQPSDKDNNK